MNAQKSYLALGLMSGTSMDGVDAALLKTDGLNYVRPLGHVSIPYDASTKCLFKMAEYAVRYHSGNMKAVKKSFDADAGRYLSIDLGLTDVAAKQKHKSLRQYLYNDETRLLMFDDVVTLSTKVHRDAVRKLLKETGYAAAQIDIVGYHGQTLFHKPEKGVSIIVGNGKSLATSVKIPVINDFRAADIASGGTGAPFAPLYHQALALQDGLVPLAVVNCGGISNITIIPNAHLDDLIAFDTGPGNGLIDRLIRLRTKGLESMDKDGKYGLKGLVHEGLLKGLYESSLIKEGENYFEMLPPKCLDIGEMKLIPEIDRLRLEDAAATLEAFTADTIVHSLDFIDVDVPKNWVLAGGGWRNPVILREFIKRLKRKVGTAVVVQTADDIGWHGQALEAQIFAFLAIRSLKGLPLSVPGTTGVSRAISGGIFHEGR